MPENILFNLRNIPVVELTQSRIKKEERKEDLHYYDIRHSDDDWGEPSTVESGVWVNHFGTLATTAPLELEEHVGLLLSEEEQSLINQHI
ncbi:hypothetical protein C2I27_03650 [Priestia megaterium]|uniref:LPD28 domain-containing protein n=1 Tax=Priestia megaterium TaxID=1404 RepID=UPI000D51EDD1|nr:LPD28 domain-containing protein [Priestia megaterium]PVC74994.1 hypothetical protein C2I27_03650 [Priestia megaterium]